MIFWIVAACMIAGALAALLAPLLWPRERDMDSADYDIEVYRDQIAELGRDTERGLLTGEEAEAARVEIARRILAADAHREAAAGEPPGSGQLARTAAVAIIAALLPAGALAIYLLLGQPGAPSMPLAERTDLPTRSAGDVPQARAVAELRARAQANPSDAMTWRNLAEAYKSSRQFEDAVAAYRRALSLEPATPELNGGYGEALAMAAGGTITPEARAAFEAVLAAEPGDPLARHYMAVADYQAGRTGDALDRWAALVAESPADAPWLDVVRENIARAAADLGLDAAAVTPEPLSPTGGPGGAPDIAAMVERLAARLEDEGGDLEGWLMLARSYTVLERHTEARDAMARAAALAPESTEILTLQARAIRAANGETQSAESVAIMRRVLALEPDNLEALWFVGLAEAETGNAAGARALLERAWALVPEDSPERETLRRRIDELTGG